MNKKGSGIQGFEGSSETMLNGKGVRQKPLGPWSLGRLGLFFPVEQGLSSRRDILLLFVYSSVNQLQ